jgi:hypothetical protein
MNLVAAISSAKRLFSMQGRFDGSPEFCMGHVIFTLNERKSRIPQLQGVQGRSRIYILRALGNAEDGVASAFLKGKQNGIKNGHFQSTMRKVAELHVYLRFARLIS